MGIFKNIWNKIGDNYAIADMNEHYDNLFQDIQFELKNKNSVVAFHKINKLFKYKWLKDFPQNHLFEKNENTKASFYAEVCLLLDKDGEYEYALKALNRIPNSSPHKVLVTTEISSDLSDLYYK